MRLQRVCRFSKRSSIVCLVVPLAIYAILIYNSSPTTKRADPVLTPTVWGASRHTQNVSTDLQVGTSHGEKRRTEKDPVKMDDSQVVSRSSLMSLNNTIVNTLQIAAHGPSEGSGRLENPMEVQNDPLSTHYTDQVLLAGKLRSHLVEFSIGLVTVSREKSNYFFDTLASLLSNTNDEDKEVMTIIVMLADRNQSKNTAILSEIRMKYTPELEGGLLLVIRGAETEFLFHEKRVKRTYNDPLDRVQWRSKQNLDYAAVMEFCRNHSRYYLHVEDDVEAAKNYIRHLRAFIRSNADENWAMLEVCPHGFIGKLFRNSDLAKLVMILRAFYREHPCDYLIKPFFIHLMAQSHPIIRKPALFYHKGKYSSLVNVTRKVDKILSASEVTKETRDHKNPAGYLYTNLLVYGAFDAANAYNLQKKEVFWASDVTEGKYVVIVFDAPQQLERLVIDTGFSPKVRRDILQNGSVEVGSELPSSAADKSRCPYAEHVDDFSAGRFEATFSPPRTGVRCISILVNKTQEEWLIIREIIVFVKT